ncbi:MAG: 2-amino-4-hydroxy-6-hydroxymethyldihydropteridine diphosphokinase [Woeseiaceae bacterium]
MARIYLGLGSNIEPAANLRLAARELRARFGKIGLSSVYRSAPVGFQGDDFLNMVVSAETELAPHEVVRELDAIHRVAGRERDGGKLLPRTLDIDLLLYDDQIADDAGVQLPRDDVLDYPFVLRPLAELAPDYVHPLTGRTLHDHWRNFDGQSIKLTKESVRV